MDNANSRNLRKRIKRDEGLIRAGKQLTYISLVSLAIIMSGASVERANTFLFEINFSSPFGLNVLLFFIVIFCLIRYNGFAKHYFPELKSISRMRFEDLPIMKEINPITGKRIGILAMGRQLVDDSNALVSDIRFKIKLPLKMLLEIDTHDTDGSYEGTDIVDLDKEPYKLKIRTKLKILAIHIFSIVSNFVNHQDHLTLLTPYFIGLVSIALLLINFICPDLIPEALDKLNTISTPHLTTGNSFHLVV